MNFLSNVTRPLYGGIGSILMLHRVCPEGHSGATLAETRSLEVTPENLERLVENLMHRGFTFISINELVEVLKGEYFRKRFIVLTFDDGYRDNLTFAYPILIKYNIPFTINVVTGFPNHTAILWWYLLEDLIKQPAVAFEVENERMVFDTTNEEGRQACAQAVRRLVKYAELSDYLPRVKAIFGQLGQDLQQKTRDLSLNWEELKRLGRDPLVTISAHTVNHPVLAKLAEDEVRREMLESKAELERHLGRPILHFAYPYGGKKQAEEREFQIAGKCGFLTATTTRPANIFRAHRYCMHALPRLEVSHMGGPEGLIAAMNGLTTLRYNRFRRIVTG